MYVKTLKRKLFLLGQMVRVRTTVLMFLFALMGYFYANNDTSPLKLGLIIFVLALWYANGTSLNDLADEEIDKVNLKLLQAERPLVKGNAARSELRTLALVSAVLALGLSILISPLACLFTVLALVYGYFYSTPPLKISYRGIFATLSLSALYVFYPFFLGLEASKPVPVDLVRTTLLTLPLYACFIARILLKDIRDVAGDKKFGKRTFIVRYGQATTAVTSAIFWVIGITGLAAYLNNTVFTITGIALSIPLIAVLANLAKEKLFENQLIYVAAMGRLANGVAFLVFILLLPLSAKQTTYSLAAVCILFAAMGAETLLHLRKPA
jgi:4-hydroxybenzoate polyprenyltransferase